MQKIYQVGKVYAIRSFQTDEIYIGSTFNPLFKRLSQHKLDYKKYKNEKYPYVTSFEILKHDDAYIELIEEYQDLTKEQLNQHEGRHIRNNNCVNKCIMGRTKLQHYNDNKNLICDKQKEYYQENKDKIKQHANQKIKCICGGTYTLCNKSKHMKASKHLKSIEN